MRCLPSLVFELASIVRSPALSLSLSLCFFLYLAHILLSCDCVGGRVSCERSALASGSEAGRRQNSCLFSLPPVHTHTHNNTTNAFLFCVIFCCVCGLVFQHCNFFLFRSSRYPKCCRHIRVCVCVLLFLFSVEHCKLK